MQDLESAAYEVSVLSRDVRALTATVAGTAERLAPRPPEPYRRPGRQYDALGRQIPQRLAGAVVWLRLIPGLASQFRPIPAEFLRCVLDGRRLAVACMCGAEVETDAPWSPCDCGRWFMPDGTEQAWSAGPWEEVPDAA